MIPIINSGECIKCGEPTTNLADGRQRPFCDSCERDLNAKISKGKIGKKFKKGKLVYPESQGDENDLFS